MDKNLNFGNEKQSAEDFVISSVRKIRPDSKQRVADILLGLVIAEDVEKSNRPQEAQPSCG